ncbi:MAG: hypothetical protein IKI50_04715 [Clostridia bacterium]|nr:hypothetical protein [Clostridia bacterium]
MDQKRQIAQKYRRAWRRAVCKAAVGCGAALVVAGILWLFSWQLGLVGLLLLLIAAAFFARMLVETHRQLAAWKKEQEDRVEDESFKGFRLR